MNQARCSLIPFPVAGESPFHIDDTVCAIPRPEKLFQPAQRKFALPRNVALHLCMAGIAAAFLAGAASARLAGSAPANQAASQAAGPVVEVAKHPEVQQPMPAGVISASPAVAAAREPRKIRFRLNESRKFQRVGPLELRLKKADAKKQTFTLTLQMKDKRVELQDRALAEPIRLHPHGARQSEILIHRIEAGYVEGVVHLPGTL